MVPLPRRSFLVSSRRDAVGESVVMVDGVLAQREPTAAGFERVRYAIFLVSGEVLPGVVARDGEEVPHRT